MKDVALAVVGVLCAIHLMAAARLPINPAIDCAAVVVIGWGGAAAVLTATNTDLAWRLTGSFAAAVLVFLLAKAIAASSDVGWVYSALCIVIAALCLLILLEAFGVIHFLSAPGRRPGATLGNRNLAARVICLGLPIFWRLLLAAQRKRAAALVGLAVTFAFASITVSRSRGAWLVAGALCAALPVNSMLLWRHRPGPRGVDAALIWSLAAIAGAAIAIVLPNQLDWQRPEFAASARGVFNFRSGSGRGRIIQALTSLRMIQSNPWLGTGPGNWGVIYPRYAEAGDPSVNLNAFYPGPQVPRNDFLSFAAEYGVPVAGVALMIVFGVTTRAIGMMRSRVDALRQCGVMVLAVCGAATALSAVDSVLRVSATLTLIALMLGLGLGEGRRLGQLQRAESKYRLHVRVLVVALGMASVITAEKAVREVAAFSIIRRLRSVDDLYRAVYLAPNNVEAQMLLAWGLADAKRCDLAERHLVVVAQLQPSTLAVRRVRAECKQQSAAQDPASRFFTAVEPAGIVVP